MDHRRPMDARLGFTLSRRPSSIIHHPFRGGFTLLEALIATVLVGLCIAALVAANGTMTMANGAGTDQSTAEFLAEQIRELTTMLAVVDPQTKTGFDAKEALWTAYDDVDDFDGFNTASLGGPISAGKKVLTEFAEFSQQVTVDSVNASNLDQVVADNSSDFVRVTVRVFLGGREVTSASWIRAKY